MKQFVLSLCATTALAMACMAPAGPVMLPTDGALMRQVSRVVERHDAYVTADNALSADERAGYISESQGARQLMLSMPEGIPAGLLAPQLGPVLDRHDSYVERDLSIDLLMRDTYLASSDGLRSLLKQSIGSGY